MNRPANGQELIALQPDLILSHGTPTTATLLQQTRTIPIVFAAVSDPIGSGFVANFPRPGVQRDRIGSWEISGLAIGVESVPRTMVRIGKVRSRSR